MRDWPIVLILALMLILGIFVKITSFEIDLCNDRMNKLEERVVNLEHKARVYGY